MKSYMELCEDCDRCAASPRDISTRLLNLIRLPSYPDDCYSFLTENYPGVFGHLIPPTVASFTWNEHWTVDHNQKTVQLRGTSYAARTNALKSTLLSEREKGTFNVLKQWTNECVPIFGPARELVATIERSAASLFGIATYGVQLITYCECDGAIAIWAARRASHKALYPNKLGVTVDGTVGGGLRALKTPFKYLIRKAGEEASLPANLIAESAKAVGIIRYVTASDATSARESEPGLIRAEVQYVYDMKVGLDVTPTPFDGEVSEFRLYTVEEVKRALGKGEFTPANACLILDFFVRHGIVRFENEVDYTRILTRLRRPLGIYTA
jgi:isopentenyldiphosphate isomerase